MEPWLRPAVECVNISSTRDHGRSKPRTRCPRPRRTFSCGLWAWRRSTAALLRSTCTPRASLSGSPAAGFPAAHDTARGAGAGARTAGRSEAGGCQCSQRSGCRARRGGRGGQPCRALAAGSRRCWQPRAGAGAGGGARGRREMLRAPGGGSACACARGGPVHVPPELRGGTASGTVPAASRRCVHTAASSTAQPTDELHPAVLIHRAQYARSGLYSRVGGDTTGMQGCSRTHVLLGGSSPEYCTGGRPRGGTLVPNVAATAAVGVTTTTTPPQGRPLPRRARLQPWHPAARQALHVRHDSLARPA